MPTKLPLRTRCANLSFRLSFRLSFGPHFLGPHFFLGQLLCAAICAALMAVPATGWAEQLVPYQDAARLGLERDWFAQVRVDPEQQKVLHWVLDKDQLFALTSAGDIQAIDTETGETLWNTRVHVGQADAVGIAVNSKYVAMVGAGRLYLMDRADGHHLWTRPLSGAASAAPALGSNHAFVALVNGIVEGYPLDDSSAIAWQYQSNGHTFHCPTVTGKVVSWPTDRGLLYVGLADSPRVLFRVEANDEIVVAPAEQAPYLYVGSLDGYLYSFHESTGNERWRYATGYAITSPPAVVAQKVFVASESPSLHAVDTLTGQPLWQIEGAKQFVACGQHHTYGMDRNGTLLALDNESGGIAGRLATGESTSAIVNDQSDRIFLTNDHGLVQCLHEIGATEPTWHRAAKVGALASKETNKDAEGSDSREFDPARASESEKAEIATPTAFEAEVAESDDASVFEF